MSALDWLKSLRSRHNHRTGASNRRSNRPRLEALEDRLVPTASIWTDQLDYAPLVFLSAKTGSGVKNLFKLIREVDDAASTRVPTAELNRFVEALHFEERKIYYVTQASIRPPTFIFFTDSAGPLHFSHERYLANQIRKRFGFRGTPVVVKTRAKKRVSERS